jgi:hypothetical protein
MLNSLVDTAFNACVRWLTKCSDFTGMTYEEVNVWLFCVLWPIVTLVLALTAYWQHKRALHYKLCWRLTLAMRRSRTRIVNDKNDDN